MQPDSKHDEQVPEQPHADLEQKEVSQEEAGDIKGGALPPLGGSSSQWLRTASPSSIIPCV
jgi:hypothetical protein